MATDMGMVSWILVARTVIAGGYNRVLKVSHPDGEETLGGPATSREVPCAVMCLCR